MHEIKLNEEATSDEHKNKKIALEDEDQGLKSPKILVNKMAHKDNKSPDPHKTSGYFG